MKLFLTYIHSSKFISDTAFYVEYSCVVESKCLTLCCDAKVPQAECRALENPSFR